MITRIKKWIKRLFRWLGWKIRKPERRLYVVYNSDAPEHIGLKLRRIPRPGQMAYIKGGTKDDVARHFNIEVLGVLKLTSAQRKATGLEEFDEAYYIDGKYNDLEVKRIY